MERKNRSILRDRRDEDETAINRRGPDDSSAAATMFPPPPRVVRYRKNAAQRSVPATVCLMLCLVFGMVIGGMLIKPTWLSFAGRRIEGRVTNHGISLPTRTTSYVLEYEFTWNGQTVASRQRVDPDAYNRFGYTGTPLPLLVKDLWGRPVSCVDFDISRQQRMGVSFFGIIALAALIAILSQHLRHRRVRRILRDGDIVIGPITRNTSRKRVDYTYEPLSSSRPSPAREFAGSVTVVDKYSYFRRNYSDLPTIFYDTARPKRHVAYELCGFEIVDARR